MTDDQLPKMLQFLYGESADSSRLDQDPRLKRWADAFELWLLELKEQFEKSRHGIANAAWQRLLRQQQKAPWELDQADIQRHLDWLQAEGYAPVSAANALWMFNKFFSWCLENQVDPACPSGFNPAEGVRRPQVKLYGSTTILSREEADRLLDVLRQDTTPLGKRDYAFVLARLNLGVPLKLLLGLRWGQIEFNENEAWVRWYTGSTRIPLPLDVWHAVQSYLVASGRIPPAAFLPPISEENEDQPQPPPPISEGNGGTEGGRASTENACQPPQPLPPVSEGNGVEPQPLPPISEGNGGTEGGRDIGFIFAPLRYPGKAEPWDRREGWKEDRSVYKGQLIKMLKKYGLAAGLDPARLTLVSLRNTAVRLRLDAGASPEEIYAFMDSGEGKNSSKYRLGKMPPLPKKALHGKALSTKALSTKASPEESLPGGAPAGPGEVILPRRSGVLFQPYQGMTHGMFAQNQPPAEVQEVLKEGVVGVSEEIVCLRRLGRLLMYRQEQAATQTEMIDLMSAYTRSAFWLGELVQIEAKMNEGNEGSGVGKLDFLLISRDIEDTPESREELRKEVLERMHEPSKEDTRHLAEEVASTRLVLRRTYSLASQAETSAQLVRLADLYGKGCVRLVKLLQMGGSEDELVDQYVQGQISRYVDEIMESFGLPPSNRPLKMVKRRRNR